MCNEQHQKQKSASDKNSHNHASKHVKLSYHAPLMKLHSMKDVIQGGVGEMAESEGDGAFS